MAPLLLSLASVVGGCGKAPVAGKDMAGGARDMAMAGGDEDMATAMVELPGKRIVEGAFHLVAVTDDDHAVYQTSKDKGAFVASFAGGSPTEIAADAARIAVRGKLVFVFTGYDDASNSADLLVWSAAKGVKSLGKRSFLQAGMNSSFYLLAVTEDGQNVMYSANTADDGSSAELWIAKSDGSGAVKAFPAPVAVDTACAPALFAAGNYFLASPCPAGAAKADGGAASREAYAILASNPQKPILLQKNGRAAAADKKGTKVAVVDEAKVAKLYPITGGAATALTGNFDSGFFTADGTALIIHGNEGGMPADDVLGTLRRQVPPAMPITLVATKDVADVREVNVDSKYIIFTKAWNSNRFHSDLFLASTEKAGTPVTLSAMDDGAIFGDAFTADGSHAIYYTAANADGIGVFKSIAVAGGAPRILGDKVWTSYATKGTMVTFNDFFQKSKTFLRADILIVDVAKADKPVLLVTQADADYFVSFSKTKYVFSYGLQLEQAGIYVANVP
ncbi:MAG: hypothetical protein EXR72_14935 [Myxococcales bacterium]|nr:hypothetical protein [Myxococcales bacterium]